MAGYRGDEQSSDDGESLGYHAARYGVGSVVIGSVDLASGRILGFGHVQSVQDHYVAISLVLISAGALLIWWGWRNPA